jgi:hypothetical protein
MSIKDANIEFISNLNSLFLESLPDEENNPWEFIYSEDGDQAEEKKPINLRNKHDGELLYPSEQGCEIYASQRFYEWAPSPQRLVINNYEGIENTDKDNDPFYDLTSKTRLEELTLQDVHDLNQDLEPAWSSQHIGRYIRENSVTLAPASLTSDGCALVVFGLGLGNHLQILIDFLKPSALFIVEPDLGLLARSLETVDYTKLIPQFTGADKALDFVVSTTPEAAIEQIRSLLTVRNLFLLDGLFSFILFDKPFFQLAKQHLHSPATLKGVNYLGYFIDEIHMTMNASLNYFHIKPKVYTSSKVKSNEAHAVVVASGPSLADDIEILKQNRERYTIFCCYSTIGRLLDAGIVPDYHCDLERHNDHIPLIERGFEEQLKSIDLCCSSTCDPRMLKLYKNVYSINRGALTPSVIFTKDNDIIPNEGPDVATFAILSAIFFGYLSIHLFGVDLGTANRKVCRLPGVLDIDRRTYDTPVRGNHGRTVFSGQMLLDNKDAIEGNIFFYSQVFPDLKVYNYSNGVYINGAISSRASEFTDRLPTNYMSPPEPDFIAYPDEHVRQAWQLADMRCRSFAFLNNLRELSKDPFNISILYKISDLCNALGKPYQDQIPIRFYRGSLFRSWIILWGVYNRAYLETDEQREDMLTECKRILNEVIDSFENLTFQAIDYIENLESLDEFTFVSKLQRDNVDSKPLTLSAVSPA